MTFNFASLVSDNLDVWTTAIEYKSGVGRGGGKRIWLYGVDKLRALILDLAMRGKLVIQDPSDEPAAELLKRVAKARGFVANKRRDKDERSVPPAARDLPAGWSVVRLDELAISQAGFAFKSGGFNEQGIGLPLIRIRDVGQPFTGTYFSGEYREEFVVRRGEYLISMDGEFRVATWEGEPALLNQRVSRLQFYTDELEARFIAIELQTQLLKLQGVKAYTTVDHLSGGQIAETRISLPPLAEQRRIVAKVGELMTLCDALETESGTAIAAHHALVEALLTALTADSDAADLANNWARLEAKFDALFTTKASVDALKQTILELAVRGKLVPQDADDEPASVMLKAIKKSGSDRGSKQKSHASVPDAGQLFDLPEGWCWERFDNLIDPAFPIAYGVLVPGADQPDGVPFVRIADLSITDPSPLPEKAISPAVDVQFPRTRLRGGGDTDGSSGQHRKARRRS